MIIFYSRPDGRYGEPVDSMVFSKNVMMTFDRLATDQNKRGQFWEFWELREQRQADEREE